MISDELEKQIIDIVEKGKFNGDNIRTLKSINSNDTQLIYLLQEICEIDCFEYREEPFEHLIKKYDNKIFECLYWIIKLDVPLSCKARISDFIWKVNRSIEDAKKGCIMYQQCILESSEYDESKTNFYRLINFYIKTGKKLIPQNDIDKVVLKMIHLGEKDDTAIYVHVLETCFECALLDEDTIIEIAEKKVEELKNTVSIGILEGYMNLLEKLYGKKNEIKNLKTKTSNKDLVKLRKEMAKIYIEYTDNNEGSSLKNVYFIKEAIKSLKLAEGTETEIKNLTETLSKEQLESMGHMQKNKFKIGNSHIVKQTLETIRNLNKEELIFFLACEIPVVKQERVKESIRACRKFVFANLFPPMIVDKNGKQRAQIKPYKGAEINEDEMYFQLTKDYGIYVQSLIVPTLNYFIEKFSINEEDIEKICQNSWFIPENRRKSFAKGIKAGFDNDFITANNILIPQLENSIRELAKELGVNVYNVKDDTGNEEVLSLGNILNSKIMQDYMDGDLLFSLKGVFVSECGFNIRNDLAHGLLDDDYFNSINAILSWWLILRLCCTFSQTYIDDKSKVFEKIKSDSQ